MIEIAEDGMTAKAAWYSPGVLSEGRQGQYRSAWIFETYSQDFVKEDGEWRNWHRCLSTDFMVGPEKSWTDSVRAARLPAPGGDEIPRIGGILDRTKSGELRPDQGQNPPTPGTQASAPGQPPQGGPPQRGQGGGPGGGGPGGSFKNLKMVTYQSWTPTTMPQYKPKPPVPYRTFSETFSYVPPMPKEIEEMLLCENLMY